MAQQWSLSPTEEWLVREWRRLNHRFDDYRLEIVGTVRNSRRNIDIRPTSTHRFVDVKLDSVMQAVD